jgi:hypothetical protein
MVLWSPIRCNVSVFKRVSKKLTGNLINFFSSDYFKSMLRIKLNFVKIKLLKKLEIK